MSHAHVYVNGQKAGYWPYGYNSFFMDVTPYLKENEVNTLAVRLENEPESSVGIRERDCTAMCILSSMKRRIFRYGAL